MPPRVPPGVSLHTSVREIFWIYRLLRILAWFLIDSCVILAWFLRDSCVILDWFFRDSLRKPWINHDRHEYLPDFLLLSCYINPLRFSEICQGSFPEGGGRIIRTLRNPLTSMEQFPTDPQGSPPEILMIFKLSLVRSTIAFVRNCLRISQWARWSTRIISTASFLSKNLWSDFSTRFLNGSRGSSARPPAILEGILTKLSLILILFLRLIIED